MTYGENVWPAKCQTFVTKIVHLVGSHGWQISARARTYMLDGPRIHPPQCAIYIQNQTSSGPPLTLQFQLRRMVELKSTCLGITVIWINCAVGTLLLRHRTLCLRLRATELAESGLVLTYSALHPRHRRTSGACFDWFPGRQLSVGSLSKPHIGRV